MKIEELKKEIKNKERELKPLRDDDYRVDNLCVDIGTLKKQLSQAQEDKKKILELIEKEINNEKSANMRKAERYWTYEDELRLIKKKIEEEI